MIQAPTRPTPPQAASLPHYEITEADRARQKKIADAWQAYNGELTPPLKKMPDGTDPNVMSNRCVGVVDGGINFLFGKELEISVEKDAPDAAQELLDTTWGDKEARLPLLQKLAMNGAIAGQAFLRIVPSDGGTFRLVTVDPSTVFVETAPQDCETALLYCIEYSTSERVNGAPRQVFYREEIEAVYSIPADGAKPTSWTISHWTQVGSPQMAPKNTSWTPAGPPYTWPYPFPPLFSCQNLPLPNSYWGRPDITPDIIGLNRALNMTLSCVNLVEILYGQPLFYSTGAGESTITIQPGVIIGLQPDAKVMNVPFASDVPNAIAFGEDIRSDIDEQSGVPGVATGRIRVMPRGNLSGIAIELLFMSLLKKTEKKQCTYGKLIIDVCKALFVLNRLPEESKVTLAWQSPLPHDDLPSTQAAISKKELDISNTTLQRELGYDPEEELALSQAEDARALAAMQARQAVLGDQNMLGNAEFGAPALPGQTYPKPPKPAPAPGGGNT